MRLKNPGTLRELMAQEGLSLGKLATRAGCSKGFISHLLARRRYQCTPELAASIAECLNVPTAVLFAPVMPTASKQCAPQREVAA